MTNTSSEVDSARVQLARTHVGMTAKESREHALAMADFIETQQAFVEAQHRNIQAREAVLAILMDKLRMINGLLREGHTGPAKRLLAALVAAELSHPVDECPRLPADLFAPVAGAR